MPVDPEIRTFLEQISALEKIDLDTITPAWFREAMDSSEISLGSQKVEVESVKDYQIPVKDGKVGARFYSSDRENGSLIVYFHGGGFVFGNIESYDSLMRFLCRSSGSNVLSVEYRLAPEHKFPTAVEDAMSAYRWVLDNSGKLGIDRRKIAISGDSAGGNLCASISIICRESKVQLPVFQALFYPVVTPDQASQSHRDFSSGLFLTGKMSAWFLKQYIGSRQDLLDPRYNILSNPDLSNLPETFVFTAEYDMLRDQGETFVSRLRESGTKATGIRALGMVHGFLSFYEYSRAARNFLTLASGFLGSRLREESNTIKE